MFFSDLVHYIFAKYLDKNFASPQLLSFLQIAGQFGLWVESQIRTQLRHLFLLWLLLKVLHQRILVVCCSFLSCSCSAYSLLFYHLYALQKVSCNAWLVYLSHLFFFLQNSRIFRALLYLLAARVVYLCRKYLLCNHLWLPGFQNGVRRLKKMYLSNDWRTNTGMPELFPQSSGCEEVNFL